jgi:hypothetical protein
MRPLISFLNYQKRNWVYNFHANEPYSEHYNISNLFLAINVKFYYLSKNTQIIVELDISCMG